MTTQKNKNNVRTTQTQTNVEDGRVKDCGPCPLFSSFTLAFALQLRKKHGKTSIRVSQETSVRLRITSVPVSIHIAKITLILQSPPKPAHYKIHLYTHYSTI